MVTSTFYKSVLRHRTVKQMTSGHTARKRKRRAPTQAVPPACQECEPTGDPAVTKTPQNNSAVGYDQLFILKSCMWAIKEKRRAISRVGFISF